MYLRMLNGYFVQGSRAAFSKHQLKKSKSKNDDNIARVIALTAASTSEVRLKACKMQNVDDSVYQYESLSSGLQALV